MITIDVSVVLNMHREALYLRPTLLSLEACAEEARNAGITVELIAVFDRPDQDTLDVFRQTPLKAFERIRSTQIDVGSLGLARNAGIELAEGEFIWTADGDDLVSRNAIVQLLHTARISPNPKVAVFIEFLAAFGEQYHVVRYVGSEWLMPADFAFQHPFVSRIFVHRSAFHSLRYRDLKLTTGFAYEDWDMNCRLFAQGYSFAIAPDAVFFYRQRVNSLLQQANSTSTRLIPHNDLFESCNFLAAMKAARNAIPDWRDFSAKRNDLYKRNFAAELMKSESMRAHVIEASLLDPEVEPMRIESASSYCSVPWSNRHWGFDLETLYTMIGTPGFTDVVLLPWLKPGGAEKYILQILGELKRQGAADKILVISGESASAHEWVSRLPPGSVFIDLYNSFPHLDRQDLSALTVRALLAVAKPQARLHLKSSEFSHEVMERFGAAIAGHMQPIYYRFSNGAFLWNEARLELPSEIRYLRKQLGHIKMLVSDCESIRDKDSGVIGITKLKHQVIYASCELSSVATPVLRTPKFRLLWASRICREKRPDLLTSIAKAVQNKFPSINIDVYGNFEHPYTDDIIKCEGLNYRGSYSGFGELPIDRYDGLLYTTAFDGLPNAILEALGAGLPVIAPAIGGIPEAVIDGETGILLDDHISEDVMAERYVQAIERVYADWSTWMTMSGKARSLIAARHSPTAHAESVKRAFAIQCAEFEQ